MKVFLSHSSKDKPFVRQIGKRLTDEGIFVWIDEAEINIGDSLIEKISDATKEIDYVAAFISENSISSRWVRKELNQAITDEVENGKIKVLPILKDKVELPNFLREKRYCNLSDKETFEQEFVVLLRTLGVNAGIVPTKDNLSLFDFIDFVELESGIYALATISNGTNNFLINPDGRPKYFEKYCNIIHIDNYGKINSSLFARDLCVGHGTLEVIDNHIFVFLNYKVSQGTFAMSGSMHVLRKQNLTIQYVKEFIKDDNWGFFPIINDKDTIRHFSFNNYMECINTQKIKNIQPFDFEEIYLANQSKHSNNILPSTNEKIVEYLTTYITKKEKNIS